MFGGCGRRRERSFANGGARSTKSANAKPFYKPVAYYVTGFSLPQFCVIFPVYGHRERIS
ncbi:hypothetical protein KCP71_05100 [Salmonella enterica subsp. enterica]|nr:hypothetical protein KCP71_05100 [Salmonella enterica subsp. enterica]